MEELPQDLGLALEDPSLKHDSDEQGDLSGSDMKIDAYRKRKMRKRRTTDTLHQTSQYNSTNHLNNSPKSSSSVDESTRNSRYMESYTANCSDETDDRPRKGQLSINGVSRTVERSHHKRVFKQARPCCYESDSHTENVPIYPRKQRKKKFKRVTADAGDSCLVMEDSEMKSQNEWKNRGKHRKNSTEGTSQSKHTQFSRNLECSQRAKNCNTCSTKACGNIPTAQGYCTNSDLSSNSQKDDSSCDCTCHIMNFGKDDSSLSGSSCNSDTDSANFTPDDIGGDGDDEMTDFYAESDGGSVVGIPRVSYLPCLALRSSQNGFKDEKVEKSTQNVFYGRNLDRSMGGNYGPSMRPHKYPKSALCYSRRHKRRMKIKKNKPKNTKDQDINQMSKLSLGNRSKRIKLDGGMNSKYSNIPNHGQGTISATISCREDVEMIFDEGGRHVNDRSS